jgi:hypothetical protein
MEWNQTQFTSTAQSFIGRSNEIIEVMALLDDPAWFNAGGAGRHRKRGWRLVARRKSMIIDGLFRRWLRHRCRKSNICRLRGYYPPNKLRSARKSFSAEEKYLLLLDNRTSTGWH